MLGNCACSCQLSCFSRVDTSLFESLPCSHPPATFLTCWHGHSFIALAYNSASTHSCVVFDRFVQCSPLLQKCPGRRLALHRTLAGTTLPARRWPGLLQQCARLPDSRRILYPCLSQCSTIH